MKAIEQYFPLVLSFNIPRKVVLAFESMDDIRNSLARLSNNSVRFTIFRKI